MVSKSQRRKRKVTRIAGKSPTGYAARTIASNLGLTEKKRPTTYSYDKKTDAYRRDVSPEESDRDRRKSSGTGGLDFHPFVPVFNRLGNMGPKGASRWLKGEFILCLLLVALYPLVRKGKTADFVSNWIKQFIALTVLFFVLMLIAKIGPKAAKFAAGLGLLVMLTLLLFEHTSKEGLLFGNIMVKLAKLLAPSKPAKSPSEKEGETLGELFRNGWPNAGFGTGQNNGSQKGGVQPA